MEMDTWEKIQYECASNGVCRYDFNRKRRVLDELVQRSSASAPAARDREPEAEPEAEAIKNKHLEAAVVRAVLKEVEGALLIEPSAKEEQPYEFY